MTTDQCIEIAEKVWGWRINGNGIILKPCGTISVTAITVEELKKDVNSWQGFGRTVEAMMSHGKTIHIYRDTDLDIDYVYFDESEQNLFSGTDNLIKYTHLAALEALKGEAVKDE